MEALERELGVDGDRTRRIGQLQQAVDARAGRQSVLEFVGRWRQGVLHQVVELDLAEGAARLLVGQHFLQADDLGREIADLLLRLVDAHQPLAQVGDDLARRLLGPVEPLVHHGGQGALLFAQRLFDPLDGVGQRHLLVAHGLFGAAGAPLAHQDRSQADDQKNHRGEQDNRKGIHCLPL